MSTNVAVIVGVGPGLGASLARRFAREGFAVALLARGPEKLKPVEAAIVKAGGKALSVACDATDPQSIATAFTRAREALGAPSVLVYNASGFLMAGVMDITPEQLEANFRVSCAGALYASQQVIPAMLERGAGTILFTGATASLRGSARFAAFATGKFALRALAQSMARELSSRGIHVAHVVIDGQIDDARAGAGPQTTLAPDAIAEAYWQLHVQPPSTWTLELDLRPNGEKF